MTGEESVSILQPVATAKELIEHVDLDRVLWYELHLEAGDETQPLDGDLQVEYRLALRSTDTIFDFRCAVRVPLEGGEILIDAAIRYVAQEPLEVPASVVVDFGTNVAIMALFPYLREAVSALAHRLEIAMMLPTLERGQLEYALPTEQNQWHADEAEPPLREA